LLAWGFESRRHVILSGARETVEAGSRKFLKEIIRDRITMYVTESHVRGDSKPD
jgi:hypothetical protein